MDTIAHADWIVDIGPGQGSTAPDRAQRTLRRTAAQQDSITGAYLSGAE
ncbi:hypothetical protein I553_9697, partial [Mycobacterium xenopi 4042]